jgi:hypothetical protein
LELLKVKLEFTSGPGPKDSRMAMEQPFTTMATDTMVNLRMDLSMVMANLLSQPMATFILENFNKEKDMAK